MRKISAELGMSVPDFVTNGDVYNALDKAAQQLDDVHVTVTDMAVYGLDYDEEAAPTSPEEDA